MNYLKTLSSAMFCAAGLAAFGAKANAAVIPVADPYFDEFPVGQTAATYLYFGCGTGCAFADNNTVGWTQSATRSAGADEGQWQIGPVPRTDTFNSDPMIGGTTPELYRPPRDQRDSVPDHLDPDRRRRNVHVGRRLGI